ncbi:hypothetical protein FALCPG4_007578 [Fusarium falciforme]
MSLLVNGLARLPQWGVYLAALSIFVVIYIISSILYNIFLHPLRKYPGPKLWAISRIPYSLAWLSGQGHKKILDLHLRYGDIVRVAPDALVFSYPDAWTDLMGHRSRGQSENGKDPDFWKDHSHAMIAANREDHGRMRKVLSHGFSAQAMLAQQPLIQNYVTMLIKKLKAASKTGEAQEMTAWYNWTTFDIIGDLSFGEPFGCLEKTYYHPWVALIFDHIKGTALLAAIRKFPFNDMIVKMMMTKEDKEKYHAHLEMSKASVSKRLALKVPRLDFLESIARAHEKGQLSQAEIMDNVDTMIVGGSETTATGLSGATYLLATNKEVFAKLAEEVRTRFKSEDEIDLLSVQKLDYMMAVIKESMRVYPPVPAAMPRKAPPEGYLLRDGRMIPPNTILGVWQWPLFHNPNFFKDPESFIPERWLDDPSFSGDQKAAFEPFSTGPRNCIGKKSVLAYAEMRLILARIIWNFDLEIDPRSEGWIDRNEIYLLWEKPDLYVRLVDSGK